MTHLPRSKRGIPADTTVRLLLGGDTMLGRKVNEVIAIHGTSYPFGPLIERTRAADLVFVNLECAITPHATRYAGPEKAFYFRANSRAIDVLQHAGVDLVSLANNHVLDAGEQGLADTIDLLDEAGIAHAGAGKTLAEASRPAIVEHDDLRFGLLAYCDHQADFAAGDTEPGIRYIDVDVPETANMLADEVAALASDVDCLVVAMHWQPNWAPYIEPTYRSLARRLVDAGADVVWGHSPHHFQGVEWIGDSVVLYSTGDLVDDYAVDPTYRNDRQLLFEVMLTQHWVERVRAFPLELDVARTAPAGDEAREWIIRRFAQFCRQVGSRIEVGRRWIDVLPE